MVTRKGKFMQGKEWKKAKRLTGGEVRALLAFVKLNGLDGVQHPPSGVRTDTVRNLVDKGYLTGSWTAWSVSRYGEPRITGAPKNEDAPT
jgi:hypothetical protein